MAGPAAPGPACHRRACLRQAAAVTAAALAGAGPAAAARAVPSVPAKYAPPPAAASRRVEGVDAGGVKESSMAELEGKECVRDLAGGRGLRREGGWRGD